ncbi:MAG: peptidoglycan DD-metalloendopeptidase family protein [Pseudomonadota bacterium]
MLLNKWNSVISMRSMKKLEKFAQATVALSLLAVVAACSTTPNKAPVVERTESTNKEGNKSQAPLAKSVAQIAADTRNSYVVKKGDTLYRIALDHGQSYSDIVAWNSLKNPNDIKVDQVLRVAPPDGSANTGVQTSSVSTGSAVEVRNLSTVSPATNKSSPKGDKRPYSEANLLEMQKTDGVTAVASSAAVKPESQITVKSVESTGAQVVSEPDAVEWIWPTEGKLISNFDDGKNKGFDISGKLGQDIFAAGAGKVMYEGSGIRGYGNLVIIKHTNALLSAYAHNKVNLVKEGQMIVKGQKIAEMGSSDSDIVKLHFEIRQQGKPVDPSKFLPGRQ